VNEHIKSLKGDCQLYRVVNPSFTPLWAVIDKPYDVYVILNIGCNVNR
jgi:hypothetical protein